MRSKARLVLGSRGSDLARTQTHLVENAIRAVFPDMDVEVRIIRTRGDERAEPLDERAGLKGLFTSEIQRALRQDEIDLAVHSAKDLPSEETPELGLGALPRGGVQDVLISREAATLHELPHQARVATGSVRRQRQLLWQRPDLEIPELRGNVPTRLRKLLASDDWTGIILAQAGLERLGFSCANSSFSFEGRELFTTLLSTNEFVPAGGQGIIALQIRKGDDLAEEVTEKISDPDAACVLQVEREFLRLLKGDCGTPVGVLARVSKSELSARAQLFVADKREPLIASVKGKMSEPRRLARRLLEQLHAGREG